MALLKTSISIFILLVTMNSLALSSDQNVAKKEDNSKNEHNLAEELVNIAKKNQHNLTMEDIDMAQSASTDQEVAEALPLPVAEKLIGHRRRNDMDLLREQMIGMIFTGEPRPLDSRSNQYENRRRIRLGPKRPSIGNDPFFQRQDDVPTEILKPLSFIPRRSNVEFPVPPLSSTEHHQRRPSASIPVATRVKPYSNFQLGSRLDRVQDPKTRQDQSFSLRSPSKDVFSNSLGPDFGPVTFEEFGPGGNLHFSNSPSNTSPKEFHKPSINPFKNPSGFSNTKFGSAELPKFEEIPKLGDIQKFDTAPKFGETPKFENVPKFEDFPQKIQNFGKVSEKLGDHHFSFESGFSEKEGCYKYTEDICLDTEIYPHEEILSSLISDPTQARTLMAEVKEQSADELVDGLTAAQESKYDYSHYFGNRRQGTVNHVHRDFAAEGGYLCPSEVKYARPKKARNSKGSWKFIVNMNKYTQTIRMEKCMKPGGTCSYVSHHYRATCNQIYNYQRLLSWEEGKGLHMDIFKVPSCCSCHIQGYSYVFPPLKPADISYVGSERVDNVLPRSDDIEELNRLAPPYSPVNYPNIDEEENAPSRRGFQTHESRLRVEDPSSEPDSRTRVQQRHPSRNSDTSDSRVNYGYHPIIDFFNERN